MRRFLLLFVVIFLLPAGASAGTKFTGTWTTSLSTSIRISENMVPPTTPKMRARIKAVMVKGRLRVDIKPLNQATGFYLRQRRLWMTKSFIGYSYSVSDQTFPDDGSCGMYGVISAMRSWSRSKLLFEFREGAYCYDGRYWDYGWTGFLKRN